MWEEEISQLKLKIEILEQDHMEELNILKLKTTDPKEQKKTTEPISLCSKRKVLESSWMKIVESESIPETVSVQDELDKNARQEVRRLQELRNYIQEECDSLLLRRDKLQEEVGCHSGYRWGHGQASTSCDTFLLPNRNLQQCQPFDSQDECCPRKSAFLVSKRKNISFPSEDLSSVAQAYKVGQKGKEDANYLS